MLNLWLIVMLNRYITCINGLIILWTFKGYFKNKYKSSTKYKFPIYHLQSHIITYLSQIGTPENKINLWKCELSFWYAFYCMYYCSIFMKDKYKLKCECLLKVFTPQKMTLRWNIIIFQFSQGKETLGWIWWLWSWLDKCTKSKKET